MSVYRVVGRTVGSVVMVLALPGGMAAPQPGPAVKAIETVTRVSAHGLLKSVANVRVLPDGRVLVVDLVAKRAVLLDATLQSAQTVTGADGRPGDTPEPLVGGFPFHGDSTVFMNRNALALVVVDPNGHAGRVMALPRPQDAAQMFGGPFGTPGFDRAGRLIYRASTTLPPSRGEGDSTVTMRQADSAAVVRIDLGTRQLDTIAMVRAERQDIIVTTSAKGEERVKVVLDALPVTDAWGVLSDGTVVVVRGVEYRLEWYAPDGARRLTPKLPYGWMRIADADKARIRDSVVAHEQAQATAAATKGAADPSGMSLHVETTPVAQMPDYWPPFRGGLRASVVRVDQRDRVWIRTNALMNGRPVYDVVDRDGRLVARYTLPLGRSIAGFGTGTVVMAVLDPQGSALIEMALIP